MAGGRGTGNTHFVVAKCALICDDFLLMLVQS